MKNRSRSNLVKYWLNDGGMMESGSTIDPPSRPYDASLLFTPAAEDCPSDAPQPQRGPRERSSLGNPAVAAEIAAAVVDAADENNI